MNAPTALRHLRPAVELLKAKHSHHGLEVDLHGYMDEDGYNVKLVTVPGTNVAIPVELDMLYQMSATLDDTMPTSEELLVESRRSARIDAAEFEQMYRDSVL